MLKKYPAGNMLMISPLMSELLFIDMQQYQPAMLFISLHVVSNQVIFHPVKVSHFRQGQSNTKQ